MPTQQERRESARVPCKLVCPFELTKVVDSHTVKLIKGSGHAINRSVKGMLLLIPNPVNKRQVVEIGALKGEEKAAHQTGGSALDPPHSCKGPSQDVSCGYSLPI